MVQCLELALLDARQVRKNDCHRAEADQKAITRLLSTRPLDLMAFRVFFSRMLGWVPSRDVPWHETPYTCLDLNFLFD